MLTSTQTGELEEEVSHCLFMIGVLHECVGADCEKEWHNQDRPNSMTASLKEGRCTCSTLMSGCRSRRRITSSYNTNCFVIVTNSRL